jgi:hypothetical protein
MTPQNKIEQLKNLLAQILDRMEKHSGDIYIRAEINGKWQTTRLTDLPAEMAIEHVCRFIRQGVLEND